MDYNEIPNNIIPPRVFTKPKKLEKDKFRAMYMDAFETEAIKQVHENIEKYHDFYRMCDNKMSYMSLSDYAPDLSYLESTLESNNIDIPTNIHHYNLIGRIINTLSSRLIELLDDYYVDDTGEIAKNEFLESLTDIFHKNIGESINRAVKLELTKQGINPENQKKFAFEEEKKQYQQFLSQKIQEATPKAQIEALKKGFKTMGVKWSEATLKCDEERMDLIKQYVELFKHYLKTGTCAKVIKRVGNTYSSFVKDSRKVFHSKDIDKEDLSLFEYAGTLEYMTPDQIIEKYGEYIDAKTTENILGGKDGKNFDAFTSEYADGDISDAINGIRFKNETHPFTGYRHKKYMEHIEDMSGLPLGYRRTINSDGTYEDVNTYIPRHNGLANFGLQAEFVDDRYDELPTTMGQVTHVYFRGYEYIGYLYYTTEEGLPMMETITKDISPDFIKKHDIKQIYTDSVVQMNDERYKNTIVWQYKPYVYEGVKIQCSNLKKPLYPVFGKMDMQITDETDSIPRLPMSGYVGVGIATEIEPYQNGFNVCMNAIRQLEEKELGMFYSVELGSLPAEVREQGDVEDILMRVRNMAKAVGIMPIINNPEDGNKRNMFDVQNVSHAQEIQMRMQLAEYYERKAYQSIGLILGREMQDTKYSTAEGIKLSNETMSNQIEHIYDDFNSFVKRDKNIHLQVAQFMQMYNYDSTIHFTKSDGSIEYLKVSREHNIPWRKLGLVVTKDSRKKKIFQQLKKYLLSQNTLGSDLLSLGKVMSTNNFTGLMQAGKEEREEAIQTERRRHENAMRELQLKQETEIKKAKQKYLLEEKSKQKDREVEIEKAYINAVGRTADNESGADLSDIKDAVNHAQREIEHEDLKEMKEKELAFRKDTEESNKDMKKKRLELEERKLDLKQKEIDTKRFTSIINKN